MVIATIFSVDIYFLHRPRTFHCQKIIYLLFWLMQSKIRRTKPFDSRKVTWYLQSAIDNYFKYLKRGGNITPLDIWNIQQKVIIFLGLNGNFQLIQLTNWNYTDELNCRYNYCCFRTWILFMLVRSRLKPVAVV